MGWGMVFDGGCMCRDVGVGLTHKRRRGRWRKRNETKGRGRTKRRKKVTVTEMETGGEERGGRGNGVRERSSAKLIITIILSSMDLQRL